MTNILVRRDQFNITPQGIIHKPTDAAFTPYPGDPLSGITRLGHLGNNNPSASFSPEVVQRVMSELWAEYVVDNQQLFKRGDLNSAEPRAHHCRPDVRPALRSAEGDHFSAVVSVETK